MDTENQNSLVLKDISLGYGRHTILERLNLRTRGGRLTALIGRNGSGKSTLLHCMAGLKKPGEGSVYINGRDIYALSAEDRAKEVSFVGTERIRVRNFRCGKLVSLGRSPYTGWSGKPSPEDEEITRKALATVGMENYSERTIDSLSDGEHQRVMIARAVAQDTPVMLMDEPMAFLDIKGKYETATLLSRLASENGKNVIFSTHDLEIALDKADDIILISPSRIIQGSGASLAGSGVIAKALGLGEYGNAPRWSTSI